MSVAGKGRCQRVRVCDEKTNLCEPLLTHRRNGTTASEPGRSGSPGQGAPAPRAGARGRPACCLGGVRCIGGVSSSQALAWNRRTCRPDTDSAVHLGLCTLGGQEGEPRAADIVRGRIPRPDRGTRRAFRPPWGGGAGDLGPHRLLGRRHRPPRRAGGRQPRTLSSSRDRARDHPRCRHQSGRDHRACSEAAHGCSAQRLSQTTWAGLFESDMLLVGALRLTTKQSPPQWREPAIDE